MVRDIIKDKDYFEEIIRRDYSRLNKRIKKIEEGQIKPERENIVKDSMSGTYKNIIISRYSLGDNMSSAEVLSDYMNAVELMDETWTPKAWNMLSSDSKPLEQYTFSSFLDFSRMLSLGVLLPIPQQYLLKLVKFIDGDEVKDFLFEFLIRYAIPQRKVIQEESYSEFFHVNERYGVLKEIINETDKLVAQRKLKDFLETKWYQSFKGTPLYNLHDNPHNIYVGYWCFQAAAITKIMELDDSSYRNNQYYPKDLL
ncbi:PoNe immunity protein domain-containing protein [uncultured Kordia sp.]|uniref:PoNe immunity protein domain-containing protein n=1 Tax=uncultured Kordia sp. TaxID=507699 RepID=UPI0026231D75|nr:PoNe immunity protein domain-containing protein [uncultured Kordia sp.]